MCRKLFLLFSVLSICGQLYAQEIMNNKDHRPDKVDKLNDNPLDTLFAPTWEPSTSVFLELLGKGFYSVNVDFRKTSTKAFSIGLQYVGDGFWPSLMYYHFSGKRLRFETGGGLSGILTKEDGIAGMGIHGVVGYRYQKKNGLLFRGGFTPFIGIPFTSDGKFVIVPFPGVSLGYSF